LGAGWTFDHTIQQWAREPVCEACGAIAEPPSAAVGGPPATRPPAPRPPAPILAVAGGGGSSRTRPQASSSKGAQGEGQGPPVPLVGVPPPVPLDGTKNTLGVEAAGEACVVRRKEFCKNITWFEGHYKQHSAALKYLRQKCEDAGNLIGYAFSPRTRPQSRRSPTRKDQGF